MAGEADENARRGVEVTGDGVRIVDAFMDEEVECERGVEETEEDEEERDEVKVEEEEEEEEEEEKRVEIVEGNP